MCSASSGTPEFVSCIRSSSQSCQVETRRIFRPGIDHQANCCGPRCSGSANGRSQRRIEQRIDADSRATCHVCGSLRDCAGNEHPNGRYGRSAPAHRLPKRATPLESRRSLLASFPLASSPFSGRDGQIVVSICASFDFLHRDTRGVKCGDCVPQIVFSASSSCVWG